MTPALAAIGREYGIDFSGASTMHDPQTWNLPNGDKATMSNDAEPDEKEYQRGYEEAVAACAALGWKTPVSLQVERATAIPGRERVLREAVEDLLSIWDDDQNIWPDTIDQLRAALKGE